MTAGGSKAAKKGTKKGVLGGYVCDCVVCDYELYDSKCSRDEGLTFEPKK